MITLYTFGPMLGLPDPSPFCMKAHALLKISGLDFKREPADLRKAPKGKAPYMEDDGKIISDSTFIRKHLENKYEINFDEGLNDQDKAVAWSFEKLCEDNLYWAIVHSRWTIDKNFQAGPVTFFNEVPKLIRPFVVKMVRRQVFRDLKGQGLGRHSEPEIVVIATEGINAIASFLKEKPYLMGNTPSGADAMVFSTMTNLLCDRFDTPLLAATQKHANLVAYRDRLVSKYFPEFVVKTE